MYFALVGVLVGIVGLAALPSLLAPKRPLAPALPAPEAPSTAEPIPEPPTTPEPVQMLRQGFTTQFKTEAKDERVHNITLGAEKLNGSVLEPGAEWSFNTTVGPRTKERGFKKAPTLVMGEVIPNLGGGMCQVSSTVHAAALLAGLDIVKRQPHSRPSTYIQRGFDATVNYPPSCWEGKQDPNVCFDLVVRNPYDFPLTIKTRIHEPLKPTEVPKKALTVELWGTGEVAYVTTKWELYSTPPFEKKWRRAWRKGDWKKKQQNGQNGSNGGLSLNIVWPDGRKETKVIYSKYPPVKEVWYVGKDWPEGVNPWEE